MAQPPPVTPRELGGPLAHPLELEAQLDRTAGRSRNYTGGTASGRTLTLTDGNDYVWWSAGGRVLLNRDGRRYQGLRGLEDVRRRRG